MTPEYFPAVATHSIGFSPNWVTQPMSVVDGELLKKLIQYWAPSVSFSEQSIS